MSHKRLEEQEYFVQYRTLEKIPHSELLWDNKQIIRLREDIYQSVYQTITTGNELSLYNHYNPINTDLIRNFQTTPNDFNGASIAKIIWRKDGQPILDGKSLVNVQVQKMFNVFLEEIKDEDLQKSIAFFWKNWTVYDLLVWLNQKFYAGSLSVEEIEQTQRLFFRQIILAQ